MRISTLWRGGRAAPPLISHSSFPRMVLPFQPQLCTGLIYMGSFSISTVFNVLIKVLHHFWQKWNAALLTLDLGDFTQALKMHTHQTHVHRHTVLITYMYCEDSQQRTLNLRKTYEDSQQITLNLRKTE